MCHVTPINSDRFHAIRVTLASDATKQLTIGAYMPDSSHLLDEYWSCLSDLEQLHVLLPSINLSPCVIGGDLNAHMIILHPLMLKASSGNTFWTQPACMYIPSLQPLGLHTPTLVVATMQPLITFLPQMTVSLLFTCKIIDENSLNTSDHLLLSLAFDIFCIHQSQFLSSESKINWKMAITNGKHYSTAISNFLGYVDSPPCG